MIGGQDRSTALLNSARDTMDTWYLTRSFCIFLKLCQWSLLWFSSIFGIRPRLEKTWKQMVRHSSARQGLNWVLEKSMKDVLRWSALFLKRIRPKICALYYYISSHVLTTLRYRYRSRILNWMLKILPLTPLSAWASPNIIGYFLTKRRAHPRLLKPNKSGKEQYQEFNP